MLRPNLKSHFQACKVLASSLCKHLAAHWSLYYRIVFFFSTIFTLFSHPLNPKPLTINPKP